MTKQVPQQRRSRPEIKAMLERAGITPTQQRLDIARIILDHPQHLSADQLLDRVRQQGRRVSKATVYNTLGLFVRRGVLRQVLVDPNRVFFDSNTSEHCHIFNEDTGTLLDVHLEGSGTVPLPELPPGTTLVDVDIILRVRNADQDSG